MGAAWGREGPGLGEKTLHALCTHLRQPVALKKTSGSTVSRAMFLLPSQEPEKGMMTRSARTGKASAMSSSFSSSVDDRFQSSPGRGWHSQPHTCQAQQDPGAEWSPSPPSLRSLRKCRLPARPGLSNLLSCCFRSPFPRSQPECRFSGGREHLELSTEVTITHTDGDQKTVTDKWFSV